MWWEEHSAWDWKHDSAVLSVSVSGLVWLCVYADELFVNVAYVNVWDMIAIHLEGDQYCVRYCSGVTVNMVADTVAAQLSGANCWV